MIGIYLPLPQSQMNQSRVAFLKGLEFQYDTDLHLFQAQIAPLSQCKINQLGVQFEIVDAFLRIRESDIEIYTDDRRGSSSICHPRSARSARTASVESLPSLID